MKNEGRIRQILFNEVTFIISLVAIAIGITLFITGPDSALKNDISLIQKDIHNITTNHLTDIEKALDKISVDVDINDKNINEINIKLERILTLLGE